MSRTVLDRPRANGKTTAHLRERLVRALQQRHDDLHHQAVAHDRWIALGRDMFRLHHRPRWLVDVPNA